MPDKFSIPVSVDPTGVAPGVAATVDGLKTVAASVEQVKAAAEGSGKGFMNMVEEAGTMREADRISMGLFDTMAGGGRTIQGVTEIMRFFLLTAVDLNPVMLAATVILGGLAAAFARHAEHTGDAKEATDALKKSEEASGTAAQEAADKRIEAIRRVVDAFGGLMKQEDAYNDSLERQAQYEQKAMDNTEKLVAAKTKLAIADLENQRQVALGNAQSKEQVDAINDRFKNLIEGTQGQSDADILQKKVAASALDIAAKEGQRQRARDDLDSTVAERQKHRDDTAQAQQDAADAGVFPDETGSYVAARQALQAQVDEMVKRSMTRPNDMELVEKIREADVKLNAARKASDYTQGLPKWEEKLNPQIDKLTKQFEDLGSALDRAKTDNTILQIEQQAAATTAQTKQLAETQSQQQQAAEEKYHTDRAKLEAQKKDLETQGKNPALDETQKASLHAAGGALDGKIAQLQLDNAGVLKLTNAEKLGLQADVKDDALQSDFALGLGQKKDEAQQQRLARQQAEKIKRQLEARPDHKLLEPQIRQAEANSGNAPVALVAQLQSLLGERMETTAAAGSSTASALQDHVQKTNAHLAKIDQHLASHKSKLQSLSNGGNN